MSLCIEDIMISLVLCIAKFVFQKSKNLKLAESSSKKREAVVITAVIIQLKDFAYLQVLGITFGGFKVVKI